MLRTNMEKETEKRKSRDGETGKERPRAMGIVEIASAALIVIGAIARYAPIAAQGIPVETARIETQVLTPHVHDDDDGAAAHHGTGDGGVTELSCEFGPPAFVADTVESWLTEEAPEDGSIGRWADKYYVVHSYSPYGAAVLNIQPGEWYMLDGRSHYVVGAITIAKSSTIGDVYAQTGSRNWTFIQTCVPGEDNNRVVYGR
jgi:hypothetical protein